MALRLPFAVCAVILLATSACSRQSTNPTAVALRECRVPGLDSAVQCATLKVPEDRGNPDGRTIPLNIVVLPATARSKLPDPIFFFAGGPSQAASDFAKPALAMFGGLNGKRDIVLVDQRGTGRSNGLFCKTGDPWDIAALSPQARDVRSVQELEKCRDDLLQRADLTRYTTTIAMADIDAVRAALGYDQINLWGGSYGTRAAQEYLRRYPERVRSVILDGVAPPSLVLPAHFSRDAGAALEKGLAACAESATCAKRHEHLNRNLRNLLADLSRNPARIQLADPLSGAPRMVIMDADLMAGFVFTTLYSPEAFALVPHVIQRARQGDYTPWAALTSVMSADAEDKNAMGMRLSVMCAEDIPRLEGRTPPTDEFFGNLFVREFSKSCRGWPKAAVPADFHTPVKSDRPVLILSGGLDPVTPPAYGEEVKTTFPNSVHFVAPHVGHGVSLKGCAPKLIRRFVESGKVEGLDGKCLERLPRPTFFEPIERRESRPGVEVPAK